MVGLYLDALDEGEKVPGQQATLGHSVFEGVGMYRPVGVAFVRTGMWSGVAGPHIVVYCAGSQSQRPTKSLKLPKDLKMRIYFVGQPYW